MKKLSIIGTAMALLAGVLTGCSSNTPFPPVSQVADITSNLGQNVPVESLVIPTRPTLPEELTKLGYVQSTIVDSVDEDGQPYVLSAWTTPANGYNITVKQRGPLPLVASISDTIAPGTNAKVLRCGALTGDGVSLGEKLQSFTAKRDAYLESKGDRKLDSTPVGDDYRVIEPSQARNCFVSAP